MTMMSFQTSKANLRKNLPNLPKKTELTLRKRRKAPDGKKLRVSRSTGEEKENKESSSYESEEDLTPPATPPLLNGHVVRHQESLVNGGHNLTLTQADLHPQTNL